MENRENEALAEEIIGDPRIGAAAIVKASGLASTIKQAFQFPDGFEQFVVLNADGIGEYLNADEIEILEESKVKDKGFSKDPVINPLLGQNVEALGHRGEVDTMTTHGGTKLFHVNCNDGRRLDHVAEDDIVVLKETKKRWFR